MPYLFGDALTMHSTHDEARVHEFVDAYLVLHSDVDIAGVESEFDYRSDHANDEASNDGGRKRRPGGRKAKPCKLVTRARVLAHFLDSFSFFGS